MSVGGINTTNGNISLDNVGSVSASTGASSKATDTINQTDSSITKIESEKTPSSQDFKAVENLRQQDKSTIHIGDEKNAGQLSKALSKTTQTTEKIASNGLATKENINQFQKVMNSAEISGQKDSVKTEGHPHLDKATNAAVQELFNEEKKEINKEDHEKMFNQLKKEGFLDKHGNVNFKKFGMSGSTIKKAEVSLKDGKLSFHFKYERGEKTQKCMQAFKDKLKEIKNDEGLAVDIKLNPEAMGPLSDVEKNVIANGGQIQYTSLGEDKFMRFTLDPGRSGQGDGLGIDSCRTEKGETTNLSSMKIPLNVVFDNGEFNGKSGIGKKLLPNWTNKVNNLKIQENRSQIFIFKNRLDFTNEGEVESTQNEVWHAVFEYLRITAGSNVGGADKDNINSNAENLEKTIEEKTQPNSNPQNFSNKWVSGKINKEGERKYKFLASARQLQGSRKIIAEGGIPTFSNVDESNLKQASVTYKLPENHRVDINKSLLSDQNDSMGGINKLSASMKAEVNAEVEAIPTQKAQVAKDSGLNSAEVQQTTEQKAISSEKYKLPENSYVDILQKSSLNSKTAGQNPVDTASSQSSTISTAKALVTKAKDKRLLLDAIGKLNDEVKRLSDLLGGYDMNTGNINESNSAFNLTLDKINDTLDTIEESTNDENVKRNIGEIKAVVSRGKKPDNRKELLDAARKLADLMRGLETSAVDDPNVRSQPQESPGRKLINGSEFQKNKMFYEMRAKLDNRISHGQYIFKDVDEFTEAVEDFEKTSESKITNNYWDNFEKWYAEKNGGSPVRK